MYSWIALFISVVYFFVNYPPTTRIYTYCRPLSLHVALPIPRNRRTPGARYFGPYPKIWAVRDTIDLMVRAFPIRTCSDSSYKRAMATGRPCFPGQRSEEHTSELQSLMRNSYAVFCLKKKNNDHKHTKLT